MESIDRILADLKAQNSEPESKPVERTAIEQTAIDKTTIDKAARPPVRSLDQLLNQLGEPQKRTIRDQLSRRHQSNPHHPFPPERQNSSPDISPSSTPSPPPPPNHRDSLMLKQLKAKYQTEDAAIAQQQQQRAAEQQQRVEAQQAQARRELEQAAQEWLKQINVDSEEGLWFEEFAYNYASRLEAAIEYLEALGTAT